MRLALRERQGRYGLVRTAEGGRVYPTLIFLVS